MHLKRSILAAINEYSKIVMLAAYFQLPRENIDLMRFISIHCCWYLNLFICFVLLIDGRLCVWFQTVLGPYSIVQSHKNTTHSIQKASQKSTAFSYIKNVSCSNNIWVHDSRLPGKFITSHALNFTKRVFVIPYFISNSLESCFSTDVYIKIGYWALPK